MLETYEKMKGCYVIRNYELERINSFISEKTHTLEEKKMVDKYVCDKEKNNINFKIFSIEIKSINIKEIYDMFDVLSLEDNENGKVKVKIRALEEEVIAWILGVSRSEIVLIDPIETVDKIKCRVDELAHKYYMEGEDNGKKN